MLVSVLAHHDERRATNPGLPLSCWEAREQVSSYIDDDLEPARRAALEVHLAGCATCPPLYQALVGATASLGSLYDTESVVPAALADQVRRHLYLAAYCEAATAKEHEHE